MRSSSDVVPLRPSNRPAPRELQSSMLVKGRVIQENIKKPIADEILFGKLKNGGTVRVLLDRENDKLAFEYIPADKPASAPSSHGKKKPKEEV